MSAVLGIDYGGTDTKLLLSGGEREVVPSGTLEVLAEQVRSFSRRHPVERFAVTIAGTLDASTGIVGRSTNMPWLDGVAPAEVLTAQLGIPGLAVQDGIAAASAEAALGAGRGADDVFVIALGTGVAGAHLVAGRARPGAHGGAGEIGHIYVGGTSRCSCGQIGCLETFIGGSELPRRWAERGGRPGTRAEELFAASADGDATASAVVDEACDALARALLQVSALVDPGVIVIGGGLARSPEHIVFPAVERATRDATFHRLPEIRLAELGVWAGAHGAVLAAR